MSQTILKVFGDAFILVLGDKAAAVDNNVRITARSISKVLYGRRLLICSDYFKLMGLIGIESCCVVGRLVPSPWRRFGHVPVTDKTPIARDDVRVSTLPIAPVRRILDVLGASQLFRDVIHHFFNLSRSKTHKRID